MRLSYFLMRNINDAWNLLLGQGFGKTFDKLKLISCEKGQCIAEMKLSKEHLNIANTLHGGLIATLIDHVTSFAILSYQYPDLKPSFSINMSISYLNKAHIGDTIVVDSVCEKRGKQISFTRAKIYQKSDPDILIATGEHAKYHPTSPQSTPSSPSNNITHTSQQTQPLPLIPTTFL